jgi:oxygen-independent coproporphyrinogen-3 oxidase
MKSGIYIHVPWCRRRCPYCNFYLEVGTPDNNYLNTLKKEFEVRSSVWLAHKASTLYFGGGTPSLLGPEKITDLIGYFNNNLHSDAEITLEANPEDITDDYARALAASGVNRISLGSQSFDNNILKKLGRMHDEAQALGAIDILQKYFDNISVDLIIGVHDESKKNLHTIIHKLYKLNIKHISMYLLTIEKDTNFARRIASGTLKEPQEEKQAFIYTYLQEKLLALGYKQYDISSFALADSFMSKHNQLYWAQGSYVGLGPGAHSMRFLEDKGIERAHHKAGLKAWLDDPVRTGSFELDRLSNKEALLEALAFGLRNMHTGINPHALALRHQQPLPAQWELIIEKFCKNGFLEKKGSQITISHKGALFADAIMREII